MWNGSEYDRISSHMEEMGRRVVDRLELQGDELCLDGGCGSGRVTEYLASRLPEGEVVAIDGDESMLEAARGRLSDLPNVSLHKADLTGFLLDLPADAALSTGTFHWIADHDRLFSCLRSNLSPGAQLEAQCGGEGNLSKVFAVADQVGGRDPFASYLSGFVNPTNFASPEESERRLVKAGFSGSRAWLEPNPVPADRDFLRAVILAPRLSLLPAPLVGLFLDQVMEEVDELDYVRLNISARA